MKKHIRIISWKF